MTSPLPVDANGFTVFTASGTPHDGYSASTPTTTTNVIHVSTSGFDTEGTGASQGDGSSAHPYRHITKGMSRLRNGSPDWLLLKMGDDFLDEDFCNGIQDFFTAGGKSTTEVLVVSSYTPSLPLLPNPGAAYGAMPRVMPAFEQPLIAIRRGGSNFWFTGIEGYKYDCDPTNASFMGKHQTVTFNTGATSYVTIPAGYQRDHANTGQSKSIAFDTTGTLPSPLVANTAYFLWVFTGATAGQFALQTVGVYGPGAVTSYVCTNGSVRLFITVGNFMADPVVIVGEGVSGANIPSGATVAAINTGGGVNNSSTTNGSTTVNTTSSTANVLVGQFVNPNEASLNLLFPTPTRVVSKTSSTIVVDNPATATSGGNLYLCPVIDVDAGHACTGSGTGQATFSPLDSSAIVLSGGSGTHTGWLGFYQPMGITTCDDVGSYDNIWHEDLLIRFFQNGLELGGLNGSSASTNIGYRRNRVIKNWAQGIHGGGVPVGLVVEENFFDTNSWQPDYLFAPWDRNNVFNHDIYLAGDSIPPQVYLDPFQGNIIARDGSGGGQLRNGGRTHNNLYVDCPGGHNWGMIDGPSRTQSITYDVHTEGVFHQDFGKQIDTTKSDGNLDLSYNLFLNGAEGQGGGAWVEWIGASAFIGTITSDHNISRGFANHATPPSAFFSLGSHDIEDPTDSGTYPFKSRTIATYMVDILGQPGGSTWRDYLALCALQRKGNWNPLLMAESVNDYLREGSGLPFGPNGSAYADGVSPTPPPILMAQICM